MKGPALAKTEDVQGASLFRCTQSWEAQLSPIPLLPIPILLERTPRSCHLGALPYKEWPRARIRQHHKHRPPRLAMITHEIQRAKHKIEMKS